MAIRWGIITDNPCEHVKRITEKKRNRYVEDHEFLTARQHAPPIIQQAMDFAYITALRKGDILTVKLSDLTDAGILVEVNKTGKKQLIEWSEALRVCVEQTKQARQSILSEYLFCNSDGQPYTVSGFDTNWQKMMRRLFKEGIITERFRFHDLRRKAATDAERLGGREFARQLLGHTHQATTAIYISGAERVKPLK